MNRLANAASPYLLQHKDNPVHWWEWGPDALKEAKRTGKPILLSIGYAACHWCHVMAHESFEDESIAGVMNDLFINIKVDREERPDIDQLYMNALHLMGQQGGWPLTMFLDPNAEPFWGGTYFPPATRYGRPGFPDILRQISQLYHAEDDRILSNRTALTNALASAATITPDHFPHDRAADLSAQLLAIADPVNGGMGHAPKFPNAAILDFLWRRGRAGDPSARNHVIRTLERICLGGIYDHVGGGFSRYTVDAEWLVPHFEKMLYDNALLLPLLAYAFAETGNPMFRNRIHSTVAWLENEMRLPDGTYASSLDADSEGEEGKYYVWTLAEVQTLLGDRAEPFAKAYNITPGGNWEGVSILNRLQATETIDPEEFAVDLSVLLNARTRRVPPTRDDKVLTDWNALAVSGLAIAGRLLDETSWIERAKELYALLIPAANEPLPHSRRGQKVVVPALATDHANLAAAALDLHQATNDPRYISDCLEHIDILNQSYLCASAHAYHLAHAQTSDLAHRVIGGTDDATPNPNAVAARTLASLSSLTEENKYAMQASSIMDAFARNVAKAPTAHTGLFAASDALQSPVHVRIDAGGDNVNDALTVELQKIPEPNLVVQSANGADTRQTSALVCIGTTCSMPLTDPSAILNAVRTRRLQS